jgi:hypothetical protein
MIERHIFIVVDILHQSGGFQSHNLNSHDQNEVQLKHVAGKKEIIL